MVSSWSVLRGAVWGIPEVLLKEMLPAISNG
jgi:hypothetical protein